MLPRSEAASSPTPLSGSNAALKQAVHAFWNAEACGERYAGGATLKEQLAAQARRKYELEPYIHGFARFPEAAGKRVLEVGVGMGADHAEWARCSPAYLAGIDLTEAAIRFTKARLQFAGLSSDLRVADAEALPFDAESFDTVYSWGVLHHTPEPPKAIREILRVLRPGGTARIMLYHKYGFVFTLLWTRYALLAGQPARSIDDVVRHHAESCGTRAYTVDGARALFADFSNVTCRPVLSHGDLLEGDVGARHRGTALTLLKAFWPRRLIRRAPALLGSILLIEATK